ncbi:acyl-CoA dehydrogenase family protein [Actinomadura rugatobispora]|uniref:Acyl-CoA dehydrogenase family protein n=1 Tax=Actinomadura rugatobispora TaxID=1994 RepID=A0ABW1AEZ2_9ACTN|nr:acyl-CoA dehydrogenase family protein [Actinomadura rugatobispora]
MTLPAETTAPAAPGASAAFEDALAGIADRAAEHDRDASFPFEAFEALHRAGTLNLTVPAELGGGGADLPEAIRVVRAVGAADPSVALVLAMHLINHAALRHPDNAWPPGVRAEVQRSSLEGVALINGLRVEPDLGTPARGGLPGTVAERTGDGWTLRGHKIYSTGIPGLRWLLVWARTAGDEPSAGSFLVPAGTPGYRVEPTWDHLGMRATRSDDVILEGVTVPAGHAVELAPATGRPSRPAPWVAFWNALLITAIYDGVARAARDWLVGYLNERAPSNLGRPLATLPRFQTAVGRVEGLLLANDALLTAPDTARAGLIKHTVTGNAMQAVELALSLTGNPGLSRRNPLERHYRNVLCSRIHTPQDDTILLDAGSTALTP